MKKILKTIILFILLFLPFGIKAYGIDNYFIDAIIEENGDLLVQEYFNLTGEYNGFERIIDYANDKLYEFDSNMTSFGGSLIHNGDDLEIIEVRALPINDNFSFDNIGGDIFNLDQNAKKGEYGVYEENSKTNGKSILIYNPSSYNKAFYIKYRIKNIAVRHNDVGEIGWNIVGDELRESVGNLKLYLHIPNNNNVKAWAHGPLNGQVSIVDNETVLLTISGLSSYRAIDIRATFDLNVINKSTKNTNVDALDKIILYEEDKAEQANYERQNEEKKIIQNAEYYLSEFETYVRRFYYEEALEYINKISDLDIKNKYLERIKKTKILLDQEEEKTARYSINYALENPQYRYYEIAKEDIEVLDNQTVKEELLTKLELVLQKVKENERKKEVVNWIVGFVILSIMIIVGYFIYLFYRKDPKAEFNQKYFRDFPTDDSPEVVSYLFNRKITDNAMSAAMMDLVRKKIVLTEKQDKNNYKLTINPDYQEELTDTENKLISLIFHGNSIVYTDTMKEYAKKNYSSFISRWNAYKKTSLSAGEKKGFYEYDCKDKTKKKNSSFTLYLYFIFVFSLIIMAISPILLLFEVFALFIYLIYFIYKKIKGMINNKKKYDIKKLVIYITFTILEIFSFGKIVSILVFQKIYRSSVMLYIICIIVSIFLIILMHNKKKKTLKGVEEYKKWKALKNFLNDFGKFDDKEVNDVALWEKYLVYATLFGCSKKILKQMKLELVDAPANYFEPYYELHNMNRYITRSLVVAHSVARSAYSASASSSSGSSYSSGSGGGGGFSSGGGSFGGGGGGGRF